MTQNPPGLPSYGIINCMNPDRHKYNLQRIPRNNSVVLDNHTYVRKNFFNFFGKKTLQGHYRSCQDKDHNVPRAHDIAWHNIVFIDFKMLELDARSPLWQDLQRALDNDQPIKVLHLACNNTEQRFNHMIEYAQFFKNITWRGGLIMEYYYHNYPGEIAPIVEQLTALVPPGVLQADLYIDSMNLHVKLL